MSAAVLRFPALFLIGLICGLVGAARAHEVTPNPKLLQNALPLRNLAGGAAEDVVYRFTVPAQAQTLIVKTDGGTGDVDLFLRHAGYPSIVQFDAQSEHAGTGELIRITEPAEGDWYILVDAPTAFSGVRLTAQYELKRGAIGTVQMIPAPGLYSQRATVRLQAQARGAVIRFTTDGTIPTESSPRYRKRLTFHSDTQLCARAFSSSGTAGSAVAGDYQIRDRGTVTPLGNSLPVHHLAGMIGTGHVFKMAVPAGARKLVVHSEGGPGNAQLYLKHAVAPTNRSYSLRNRVRGNDASLSVDNPAPGDWYILLRGSTNYSGASLVAYTQLPGVDLVAWEPTLAPYVTSETFLSDQCEVQEGLITEGTHRLLRFGTETRNIGAADLVMPAPEGNPAFEFATCHGHYHFKGFARYRLLDGSGTEVATGRKVSFCLLDVIRWDPNAIISHKFNCRTQGIQAGWGDIYDSGLPGQWIDVSGLAAGVYTLEVTMNPDQVLAEDDYTNNSVSVPVIIPPETP